jgi:hypothetical protein
MNRYLVAALVSALALGSGCAKMSRSLSSAGMEDIAFGAGAPMQPSRMAESQSRMLIWRASLSVEVGNVSNAIAKATAIAKASGGYAENTSATGEENGSVRLRVPGDKLNSIVDELADLGKETYRYVSSEDVTEEYIDTDARLKNSIALRDRLRKLLDKAMDVQDIVAIEKELTRVQSDIDSMEARLKVLKNQVDLATIDLSFQRSRILGPLGYVFKGVGWVIAKLFYIR